VENEIVWVPTKSAPNYVTVGECEFLHCTFLMIKISVETHTTVTTSTVVCAATTRSANSTKMKRQRTVGQIRDHSGGKTLDVPNPEDLTREEQETQLNMLLHAILSKPIAFQRNQATLEDEAKHQIEELVFVLKTFPDFDMICEGHAAGKPHENDTHRLNLSKARAEAVKKALLDLGVKNPIAAVGIGSKKGEGMKVKMYTATSEQLKRLTRTSTCAIKNPEEMDAEEKVEYLNQELDKTMDINEAITWKKGTNELSDNQLTIAEVARVMNKFPNDAFTINVYMKGKPNENNPELKNASQARAQNVKKALKAAGLQVGMIIAAGYGCEDGKGARVVFRAMQLNPQQAGPL